MRGRLLLTFALCVTVVLSAPAQPAAAFEPGWPLPGPARTALGFGESYVSADGSASVHRGVDLEATAGSAVTAVFDGTVTFSGRVPAGEGSTTIAVTVESGDVRLTYMPLSEAWAVAGDAVDAGARLGALAASGDRSSADAHLHLGARRGSLYIDPMPFLLAPVASAGGGSSEPAPAPAGASTAAAASPVSAPAPAAAPVTVIRVQPAAAAPVTSIRVQPAASTGVTAPSTVAAGQVVSVDGRVQAADTAGAHSPAAAAHTAPGSAAAAEAGAGAGTTATSPARARGNAAGMIPDAGLSAFAVDRRAEAISSAPMPVAAIVAIAGMLGAGLLWPIWRSVPAPGVAVTAQRQDVAAVVAR